MQKMTQNCGGARTEDGKATDADCDRADEPATLLVHNRWHRLGFRYFAGEIRATRGFTGCVSLCGAKLCVVVAADLLHRCEWKRDRNVNRPAMSDRNEVSPE
jgi:hypothetical protein